MGKRSCQFSLLKWERFPEHYHKLGGAACRSPSHLDKNNGRLGSSCPCRIQSPCQCLDWKSVSSHSITLGWWKVRCRINAALCSEKLETFRGDVNTQHGMQICLIVLNDHPKQKKNQLSEKVFVWTYLQKKACLESASGLAELHFHFNMRKCTSDKRGKDVRHSRDRGKRLVKLAPF